MRVNTMGIQKSAMPFGINKTFRHSPTVGIVCPACGTEVSLNEIIERKGSVSCVYCIK